MAQLITTLGPKNADELGMILPHEHVFCRFAYLGSTRLRSGRGS